MKSTFPFHKIRKCRSLGLLLFSSSFFGFASDWIESESTQNQAEMGRIVIVENPKATHTFVPNPKIIREMIDFGLRSFWQSSSEKSGWKDLINAEDVIGIRVHSSVGKIGGTRPEVAAALIESLIQSGHSPDQIILWDRRFSSLKSAGYLSFQDRFGIKIFGARDVGYDENVFYESSLIGTVIWGDREFGQNEKGGGRKSFISKLLTKKITKIINISPLLNHNLAGVNGNLFGLAMASTDNNLRFQTLDRLQIAIPEIIALPQLGDRIILNIVDALIVQYQGQSHARLQDSAVLNQLRFSSDPVALDTLSLKEIKRQRALRNISSDADFQTIYDNASLLQIGKSNLNQISMKHLFLQNP